MACPICQKPVLMPERLSCGHEMTQARHYSGLFPGQNPNDYCGVFRLGPSPVVVVCPRDGKLTIISDGCEFPDNEIAYLTFSYARWNGNDTSFFPVSLNASIQSIKNAIAPFFDQMGSVMMNTELYDHGRKLPDEQTLKECGFQAGQQYVLQHEAKYEEFFGE